jgi:polyhydroxybutyrate depolymerase
MRALLPLFVFLCACSSSKSNGAAADDAGSDATEPATGSYDPTPFGGARPVSLFVPGSYASTTPAPLLILLHGYSASGGEEEVYLDLHPTADARGVLYAHPDGTTDSQGNEFWNATDGCCNFDGSTVDDSSYLAGLVTEIESRYNVDPKRVFFVGHSNGGFMAYRMACDHADVIAGIATLAGAMWEDTAECTPSAAVSVLQIHGTADTEVFYDGFDGGPGVGNGPYPSAPTSVGDWATYDDCVMPAETSFPQITLGYGAPDTNVSKYATGCANGSEADLWSIPDAGHIPPIGPNFAPAMFDYLLAHPKP